jgi:hypothetical protein
MTEGALHRLTDDDQAALVGGIVTRPTRRPLRTQQRRRKIQADFH